MHRISLSLALVLLAACSDEIITDDNEQAQASPDWSLADQQAAVDARAARRKAQRIPDLRKQQKPADWISVAYHGLVLDKNLDEIKLDDATVATIQQSLFDVLYPSTAYAAQKKYGKDLKLLFDTPAQGLDQRVMRAATLHGLISVADAQLRSRYVGATLIVRGAVARLIEQYQYQIPQSVRDRISQFNVGDWLPPVAPGAEYIQSCRDQQVPIPPNWPDSRWVHQGALAFTFISTGKDANVYTYRDLDVPGVCYALPRRGFVSGTIDLLGIICQSDTTGAACFWDNRTPAGSPITGTSIALQIDQIANGSNLVETCTDCHRGYNVFNIHPGSALDLSRASVRSEMPPITTARWDTSPAMRYTPVGQAHWVNPPPVALPSVPSPGTQSCIRCHEIPSSSPRTSASYCSNVLEDAARVTMARDELPRAGWPTTPGGTTGITNTNYTTHIQALSLCP